MMRSMRTATLLLILLALLSMFGTVVGPGMGSRSGRLSSVLFLLGIVDTYRSPTFIALTLLLIVNIAVCTWSRAAKLLREGQGGRRPLTWVDAGMHGALIVLVIGGVGKAVLGFVGTGYLFRGRPASSMHDPRTKGEVPIGFSLTLLERRTEYYPLQVKIGVREASTGEKRALVDVREGSAAHLAVGKLTLEILTVSDDGSHVQLAVGEPARRETLRLGLRDGKDTSVRYGGYLFSVVAYRRDVRTMRGRVQIQEEGRAVREEWLEVNRGIEHRGTKVFLVGWSNKPEEEDYFGVQYRRDPMAPVFWVGACALCVLLPLRILLRGLRSP
jgi:hypothetical protein